jgi:hypothetical protein
MRRFLIFAGVAALSASSLFAQNTTVVSFPHLGSSAPASSSYQGVGATSVTIGFNIGPPCVNCVPGITGSVTIPDPFYTYAYPEAEVGAVTLLIEDTGYTGPCSGVYIFGTKTGTPFLSGQQAISGGCVAGTDYIVSWSVEIPGNIQGTCEASPCAGNAILEGGVTTSAGTLASTVVQPMIVLPYTPPLRPGIIGPSTVTIGAQIPGLPCFDCSTFPQGDPNLSIATPLYVVPRNTPLAVSMEVKDQTYTGPCTLFYEIKEGTTVVSSGTRVITGGCTASSGKITYWGVNIPSSTTPGAAVLSGGVIAGSSTFEMSQPIMIQ